MFKIMNGRGVNVVEWMIGCGWLGGWVASWMGDCKGNCVGCGWNVDGWVYVRVDG